MRAAVVNEQHSFDIVDLDDPTPGPGELVLRVRACGICGSDLKAVEYLPPGFVMGHEFCGEVVAAASDVAAAWPHGTPVTALPAMGCGHCPACLAGEVAHCPAFVDIGVGGAPGAYAELVRVSAREAFALPETLSGRDGALVEPLAVGLHAVDRARLTPGDTVLVVGAGPVGLAVAAWARLLGAGRIAVSDPLESRRRAAAGFDIDELLDPGADELGGPYDVVFECVGHPGLLDACVGAVAPQGTVILAGACIQPDTFLPIVASMREATLAFVVYYRRRDFAHTIATLAAGRIDPDRFITGRVGLDGFAATFERLKHPSDDVKVLLEL